MLAQRELLAGEIDDYALAYPRHVVEERRHHRGCQHVDRPGREALMQQLHDRVAANEIADPHVGHDQNGRY
jgi:hypothetical protein